MRFPTSDAPPSGSRTAEIAIERIVAGGYGLGRLDGRTLLVPLTAPGDVVEVEVPDRGWRANLLRVVTPGPDRQEPACVHYGECGGCDLMHVSYPAQIRAKRDMIIETIERIGGRDLLAGVPDLVVEPNPAPHASRIRATWRPTASGGAGYVRRGTHEVIEVDRCPILDPVLESTRAGLRIERPMSGLTNGREISLAGEESEAADLEFAIAGERFLASADAFFQASGALLDGFVSHVVGLASVVRPDAVLELYAGIGLFTIPLARLAGQIISVESSPLAVEFAKRNVLRAGVGNVDLHAMTAERFVQSPRARTSRTDIVLVDPPRAGMSDIVVTAIPRLRPNRIVYVSCDPATFARDARKLAADGFELTALSGFDLFPQTHHVELVAALDRSNRHAARTSATAR